MAKKSISLAGLMNEYEDTIDQTRQKKQKNTNSPSSSKEGRGATSSRGKGSAWRQDERPFRKTVHFDNEVNTLINLVSYLYNKRIDDIIYEMTKEGIQAKYGKTPEEIMQNKK